MSMPIKPILPDLLIAIFDITILLERYKDSNGPSKFEGFDEHWQPIEISEGEVAFLHALHNKILWGKLSCNPTPELYRHYLHNSLPIELFLAYLHSKKLDIRCSLHFKNINEKLKKIEWIQQMRASKETRKEVKSAISELLSEGNIQVNLMECWELIQELFRERQKAILEIEEREAKGWVDDEYNSFEGEFLSMDLLGSKKELLPLLQTFIAKYVDHFIRQQIDWGQRNIYQWKKQRKMLMQEFILSSDRYGDTFWTPLYISPDSETKRIESIIALAIEGHIEIEEIGVKNKKTRENLQAKIRMLATSVDEKNAKTLVVTPKPTNALLIMKKDNFSRICINDIVLRTPTSGSPTDNLMGKLLDEGKNEIGADLIKEVKAGSDRPISNIVSDLLKGSVRKLFFPKISDKKLTFCRAIFQEQLDNAGLSLENVLKELSQSKKVEVSGKKSK